MVIDAFTVAAILAAVYNESFIKVIPANALREFHFEYARWKRYVASIG